MDKMSKKMSKPELSVPEDYTNWFALVAAGSALGMGMFALKEIRNTRKEITNLKKEGNEKIEKKMEKLEDQLKSINDFMRNNGTIPKPIQRPIPAKVNPVPVEPEKIVIINEPENDEEYEEVEVTDSESED